MKRVENMLLRLMALAVPTVIAACYGVVADDDFGDDGGTGSKDRKTGRVVNANTGVGIPGIRVTCLRTRDADGGTLDVPEETGGAHTDSRGNFMVSVSHPNQCTLIRAEDVDGADNGSYQPNTVSSCETCTNQEIPLTPST